MKTIGSSMRNEGDETYSSFLRFLREDGTKNNQQALDQNTMHVACLSSSVPLPHCFTGKHFWSAILPACMKIFTG